MYLTKIWQALKYLLASLHAQFAARLILGGVFVYAGVSKVVAPREFAEIVVSYHILSAKVAIYFAYVLPWVEIMLGILLVLGLGVKKAALILSVLLIAFIGAVLIRHFNGLAVSCGCFSPKSSGPVSIFLIIGRDAILLICGAYLVRGSYGGRQLTGNSPPGIL